MMTFFTLYFDTLNALRSDAKKELLKIFIKASKSISILVHGRRRFYVQKVQKSNLYFFNALFSEE